MLGDEAGSQATERRHTWALQRASPGSQEGSGRVTPIANPGNGRQPCDDGLQRDFAQLLQPAREKAKAAGISAPRLPVRKYIGELKTSQPVFRQ